jgi:hypothetical protein
VSGGFKRCAATESPPHTTDFALLFLPTESLYAEVLRRPGLLESLRREYAVTLAGPTTLLAILSSLQMGFRTLAIQQRSQEVWRLRRGLAEEPLHRAPARPGAGAARERGRGAAPQRSRSRELIRRGVGARHGLASPALEDAS